jgi:hypothetical protein
MIAIFLSKLGDLIILSIIVVLPEPKKPAMIVTVADADFINLNAEKTPSKSE